MHVSGLLGRCGLFILSSIFVHKQVVPSPSKIVAVPSGSLSSLQHLHAGLPMQQQCTHCERLCHGPVNPAVSSGHHLSPVRQQGTNLRHKTISTQSSSLTLHLVPAPGPCTWPLHLPLGPHLSPLEPSAPPWGHHTQNLFCGSWQMSCQDCLNHQQTLIAW